MASIFLNWSCPWWPMLIAAVLPRLGARPDCEVSWYLSSAQTPLISYTHSLGWVVVCEKLCILKFMTWPTQRWNMNREPNFNFIMTACMCYVICIQNERWGNRILPGSLTTDDLHYLTFSLLYKSGFEIPQHMRWGDGSNILCYGEWGNNLPSLINETSKQLSEIYD